MHSCRHAPSRREGDFPKKKRLGLGSWLPFVDDSGDGEIERSIIDGLLACFCLSSFSLGALVEHAYMNIVSA